MKNFHFVFDYQHNISAGQDRVRKKILQGRAGSGCRNLGRADSGYENLVTYRPLIGCSWPKKFLKRSNVFGVYLDWLVITRVMRSHIIGFLKAPQEQR